MGEIVIPAACVYVVGSFLVGLLVGWFATLMWVTRPQGW